MHISQYYGKIHICHVELIVPPRPHESNVSRKSLVKVTNEDYTRKMQRFTAVQLLTIGHCILVRVHISMIYVAFFSKIRICTPGVAGDTCMKLKILIRLICYVVDDNTIRKYGT